MSARFCPQCGASLRPGIPPGEDRERLRCEGCGLIHYQNPQVDAACVLRSTDGALRLGIAALHGGERIQAAAIRALAADAPSGLSEEDLALCCALTDIPAGRVCLVFRVPLIRPACEPGPGLPGWCAPLLERLAADDQRSAQAAYTADWDGVELRIAAVPRD